MTRNNKRTDAHPLGDHPRGPLISTIVAGQVLMRDPERIRQLAKTGWIAAQGNSRGRSGGAMFRLLDVVHGYIRFRDDEKMRGTKTAGQSKIAEARSREIELRNAYREGHLIEIEEALETIDALMGLLRVSLSGLPARVTRDLQLRRTIETAINDILDSIADIAAKKSKAMDSRDTSSASVEADDAGQVGGGKPNASANLRRSRAA